MAAAGGIGLMETIGLIATLVGTGESTYSLFSGSSSGDPTAVITQLKSDLTNVFNDQLASDAERQAAGVAQTAQTFFAIDYANAQEQGEDQAQLLALLTDPNRGPALQDLKAQATTMALWAKDNPEAIAQRSASLALTVYTFIVLTYRELAANTTDAKQKKALAEDMKEYAALGVSQLWPLFESVNSARPKAVGPVQNMMPSWARYQLLAFFDGWSGARLYVRDDSTPNWPNIYVAHDAWIRLLATGNDQDAALLTSILGDANFNGLTVDQVAAAQVAGKWFASAPEGIQALQNIAGALDYVVGINGSAGLRTIGAADGVRDWQLGVAPKCSPRLAPLANCGYLTAFRATGANEVWTAGSPGPTDRVNYNLAVAADGSSPSVGTAADGGFAVAYADSGSSALSMAGPNHTSAPVPGNLLVADQTSPSIARTANAAYQIAFQNQDGTLWVAGPDQRGLGIGMHNQTSPAIACFDDATWWIAVHADNGNLWAVTNGHSWDLGLPLAGGTSPTVAVAPNGALIIAFQHSSGNLWTTHGFRIEGGGSHPVDSGLKMQTGASPGIAALPINGFEIAFTNPAESLSTYQVAFKPGTLELAPVGVNGPPGARDWQSVVSPGSSPGITGLNSPLINPHAGRLLETS